MDAQTAGGSRGDAVTEADGLARLRVVSRRANYSLSSAIIEARIERELRRIRAERRRLADEDIWRQREPPVFTDSDTE